MELTTYKAYIKEITKYPLLTADEEKALSKRIALGDKAAQEKFINSNLRYVVSIALKCTNDEDSLMDYIQEGNMGLMIAVSKFDHTFETRFTTYARSWITQYILRHKKLVEPAIHIPALKLEKIRIIQNAKQILEQKMGHVPSYNELSIYTGMTESELYELEQYDYTMCSIDSQSDNNTESSIMHVLKDNVLSPEEQIIEQCERREYFELIKKLPIRECLVMTDRYRSYIDGNKTSFKIIGSKIGVSIEATRQIELRAKTKLKRLFENYYSEVYGNKIPV